MKAKVILLLFTSVIVCSASLAGVQGLLTGLLSETDKSAVPTPDKIQPQLAELITAPPSEVDAILPLVVKCLHSTNPTIRRDGLAAVMITAMRPDSAKRLDPYADEIGKLLDDADLRKPAISALGLFQPAPTQKAISNLLAHLNDSTITADAEFLVLTGSLLNTTDAKVVHSVLAATQRRATPQSKAGVIQQLGRYAIATDEAVEYTRSGLQDSSAPLRETSVLAVQKMGRTAMLKLNTELLAIAQNPAEQPTTRSYAERVLAGEPLR